MNFIVVIVSLRKWKKMEIVITFLDTFDEFCDLVELNDKLKTELRKCRSFSNSMKTVDLSYSKLSL
jgi:hypothetical protein